MMEKMKKAAKESGKRPPLQARLRTTIGTTGRAFRNSSKKLGCFLWEGLWDGLVSMASLILVVFSNFLLFKFEEWIITVYSLLFIGLILRLVMPKRPWGYLFIILGGFLDYILSLTVFHWFILLLDTLLVGSTITSLYGVYEETSIVQQ